jgi:hypothetical protein
MYTTEIMHERVRELRDAGRAASSGRGMREPSRLRARVRRAARRGR